MRFFFIDFFSKIHSFLSLDILIFQPNSLAKISLRDCLLTLRNVRVSEGDIDAKMVLEIPCGTREKGALEPGAHLPG